MLASAFALSGWTGNFAQLLETLDSFAVVSGVSLLRRGIRGVGLRIFGLCEECVANYVVDVEASRDILLLVLLLRNTKIEFHFVVARM